MGLEQRLHKEADLHKPIIVGAGAIIGGLLGGVPGAVAGAVGSYALAEAADHKSYYS